MTWQNMIDMGQNLAIILVALAAIYHYRGHLK